MCKRDTSSSATECCLHCQKPLPKEAKQKRAKFCGRACFAEYRKRPRFCTECGTQTSQGANGLCWACYTKKRGLQRTGETAPCAYCGTLVYRYAANLKATARTFGVFCSHQCFGLFVRGEKNPNYTTGKTVGRNYATGWKAAKKSALTRDGHRCVDCKKASSRLEVHHLDGSKENHALENLVTLCSTCHKLRHSARM